jgi:hypothetical protein
VEVRHRFEYDTPFFLEDAQVVLFDNRVIATHSPMAYSNRSLAQGMIAFNFDSISGRGQKSNPVYDGEWDEMLVANITTGTINGVERCFVVGRDAAGQNALWELLPETYSATGDSVTQVFESRTMFGDSPGSMKHLRRADLWFSDIIGDLNVRVKFRPTHYPYWLDWETFASVASGTQSDWGTVTPQRRAALKTHQPIEDLDPQTGRPYSTGEGFQIRIEWDGIARLDHVLVWQEMIREGPFSADYPESAPTLINPPSGASEATFWHTFDVSPLAGIE